jgi:hypothetical protein
MTNHRATIISLAWPRHSASRCHKRCAWPLTR